MSHSVMAGASTAMTARQRLRGGSVRLSRLDAAPSQSAPLSTTRIVGIRPARQFVPLLRTALGAKTRAQDRLSSLRQFHFRPFKAARSATRSAHRGTDKPGRIRMGKLSDLGKALQTITARLNLESQPLHNSATARVTIFVAARRSLRRSCSFALCALASSSVRGPAPYSTIGIPRTA